MLVSGHVLLVPVSLVARRWDLSKHPLGFGHRPAEITSSAESGSIDWALGVVPLLAVWSLLGLVLCCLLIAGLSSVSRWLRPATRLPEAS